MNQEVVSEFWKRQTSEEITPKQNWFDVIFGIIAPILCLVLDPIVFRGGFLGVSGYLQNLQLFAYIAIPLGIITLSLWMLIRIKSNILIGIISGILLVGALLGTALGIILLPLSLMGLMVILGIVGFTPFLSAFVFLRNGVRALRKIRSEMNKVLIAGTMLFGIALVVGIPFAINWEASELVSRSMYTIIHSEKEEEINSAIAKLQSAAWCSDSCYDELVWAYSEEEDEKRQEILSRAFFKLTGKSIEDRLWRLTD